MSGNRVSQAIPSFINGVSQQPPTVRLATQCELLDNALPSVSDGLCKRPCTHHQRRLWRGQLGEVFTHLINRDMQERYKLFITDGSIKVVDLLDNGREKYVDCPNGREYLRSDRPQQGFSAVTVADYTFIVNKDVIVRMTENRTAPLVHEALVWAKHGYVQTTYKVTVDGRTVEYTTPESPTQPNTQTIAEELRDKLSALGGLTVDIKSSVLRVAKADGSDFSFSVSDSWGEQALVGIKQQVAKFTELPAKAFDGFKVRVTGESKGKDDDYFVEYNSEEETRNGTWDECRGWDLQSEFDTATMPHILVSEADGTFTFSQADWEPATVGDDDTCPPPSFVDKTINAVIFHQNRLGVLTGENIVLSRDREFFAFWPKTATTALATDPIDNAGGHDKVSILHHAVPFRDALTLFAEQVQFQLTNGGAATFAPDTVRLDITTQYACSSLCPPVAAGQNVYFLVENKDNSAVMEYFMTTDGVSLDAIDVTAHVPRYVPHGVFKMIASTNDDYLMLLSNARRNVIWVYKYFYIGEDKVQSAWSQWVFPESDSILSISGVGPDIYLVIQRDDGVYLEYLNMQSIAADEGLDFQVLLDRRDVVKGHYDEQADETFWKLPYPTDDPNFSIVLGGGFQSRAGKELKPVLADNLAIVPGRYDQADCFCGLQYAERLRLSEQFIRESKETGASVVTEGRLQLLNLTLIHRNSGYFRAEVTSGNRETQIKEHIGVLGTEIFRIGKPTQDPSPFRFSVMGNSRQVVIDIINDRHYPSNLLSAEWVGLYSMDSRRV